jgi:hypothetical protein
MSPDNPETLIVGFRFANQAFWDDRLTKQRLVNVLSSLSYKVVSQGNNYFRFSKDIHTAHHRFNCHLTLQASSLLVSSADSLTLPLEQKLLSDLKQIKAVLKESSFTIIGECDYLKNILSSNE